MFRASSAPLLDEQHQWRDYLLYCAVTDSHVSTTKYTLNRMFKYSNRAKFWKSEEAKGLKEAVNRCKTLKDLLTKFGLLEAWEQRQAAWPFPTDETSPIQQVRKLTQDTTEQKRTPIAAVQDPPRKKPKVEET